MLKELSKYNNLGTPLFFWELLSTLSRSHYKEWRVYDIQKLLHNKVIDSRFIFDGCLETATHIGLIRNDQNYLFINDKCKNSLSTLAQFTDKFNELLLECLKNDSESYEIFASRYLNYDLRFKTIQINNAAFGFKYSNIKQLLLDFGILKPHPTFGFNSYLFNNKYRNLLDRTLLPEIKQRKIGVHELYFQINQQQINGEQAERFVLKFETKRLNYVRKANWIAEYVVNEGYDIASYDTLNDWNYNRFIEVKSYTGIMPYFYWSRNEINVAKLKQDKYWLYLVNKDKISDFDYVPQMIQNPYLNILENDSWTKEIDKYKINAIL